jgi:uncharacterized protein (DUF1697 family)
VAERATTVALLRGVNVGGRAKVPMGELRSVFAALGHTDVVTYIQSGNVVFRSAGGTEKELVSGIERQIADAFGLEVAVTLRAPGELAAIVAGNPFLTGGDDPKTLHVAFLDRAPAPKELAELDPDRSPPDEFRVLGREVYLRYPNGSGRSKLTIDYFERRLGVRATARNWNTVTKLLALSEG